VVTTKPQLTVDTRVASRCVIEPKLKFAALAVATITTSVALAAQARADDAAYIRLLDIGRVPYDTPNGALLMGAAVCQKLENGTLVDTMERSLMTGGRTVGEPDWTRAHADVLIGAAGVNLCPQILPMLRAYGPPFTS
jgi:hypothetical protein